VDCFDGEKVDRKKIIKAIENNFDLTPA